MGDIKSKITSMEKTAVNPFEMKFARMKHEVVGVKSKKTLGKPGATRKRGEEEVSPYI